MDDILFRASSNGALMTDGRGATITEKQLSLLSVLEMKQKENKITEKQKETLEGLKEKRDKPFELSATAKSMVLEMWMRREYDFSPPLVTNELIKGLMCEQDGIELVSEVIPSLGFRSKNIVRKTNELYTGEADVVLEDDDTVEDIKCSWNLKTFYDAGMSKMYYAQGQTYMHLWGLKKFKLHYCLVSTPKELVEAEERKLLWKFQGDEENPDFIVASERLWKSHMVNHIPKQKRVKTFSFHYDSEYMEEMDKRARLAIEYYKSLELTDNQFFENVNDILIA